MAKLRKRPIEVTGMCMVYPMTQHTPSGDRHCDAGDWLLQGVIGEQYFAKNEVIEKSYDILDEESPEQPK